MTFTYDPETTDRTRNKVRMLIGDTDTDNTDKQIFSDEELDQFESSDYYSWAADAMMAIASSSARISVACRIGNRDFEIDRKAVAKECRDQAKEFRKFSIETPSATEVSVEDEDLSYVDSFGYDQLNFETGIDDLNT